MDTGLLRRPIRFVSEMTYYVSSGTLNSTNSTRPIRQILRSPSSYTMFRRYELTPTSLTQYSDISFSYRFIITHVDGSNHPPL